VAVLVTVTAALGATAPLGSFTSPVIDPRVWADAVTADKEKAIEKINLDIFNLTVDSEQARRSAWYEQPPMLFPASRNVKRCSHEFLPSRLHRHL
jgi:hypothetical protein